MKEFFLTSNSKVSPDMSCILISSGSTVFANLMILHRHRLKKLISEREAKLPREERRVQEVNFVQFPSFWVVRSSEI